MTLIVVIVTAIVSILAFSSEDMMARMQFSPYQVYHRKQYYRLFTHGFVHADWIHLIVNMLVLHSFGTGVEYYFSELQTMGIIKSAKFFFIILYVGGLLFSPLLTLAKQKDNFYYNAVGASGAVSAVVFCYIFFSPLQKINFYFVLPIPGILFGVAYLIYSSIMSKKAKDNINHDAHFIGALFGFFFPLILDPKLVFHFINEIKGAF